MLGRHLDPLHKASDMGNARREALETVETDGLLVSDYGVSMSVI